MFPNYSSSYFPNQFRSISSIFEISTLSYLDGVRLSYGEERMRASFHEIIQRNAEEAIHLVNERKLHFTTFFLLQSDLKDHGLLDKLNTRNKIALEILNEISTIKSTIPTVKCSLCNYIQTVSSVLKWIIETGFIDDGLNDEFDEILDKAAILLTRVYRDNSILPLIVKLAFNRYNKGTCTQDLLWAFFEARDPNSLILIANHLLSPHANEVALSRNLLKFVPGIDPNVHRNPNNEYLDFLNWIKENSLFLFYTGESFQQTFDPMPYVVVLEAKYLCKGVSVRTGKILEVLTDRDQSLLNLFDSLHYDRKKLLADFSYYLHQRNINFWYSWILYPISEQIRTAETWRGYYHD